MESSSQSRAGGGLWNNPRPTQYSKETQDMLKLMMQESRLSNLQKKRINQCLENGAPLPLKPENTSAASHPQCQRTKPVSRFLPSKHQKRSAEACRAGDSYIREKFYPGPTRDLDKEKRKLQNIFALGQEEPTVTIPKCSPTSHKPEEKDRYQEVLEEIEERQQFLVDMVSMGKERDYSNIIQAEISQRLRELDMLDKIQSQNKDEETPERDEVTVGQRTGDGTATDTD